ncbi:MAG: hypothetical protein HYV18_05585 [Gammaproteobacteria bacterium]|nr:hypothetical protein [Gammaproteobacteria bacterium]
MILRKLIAWSLVLAVPGLGWSAYLYASRAMRTFSALTDGAALVMALAVGVAGIHLLPLSRRSRLAASVAYLVVAGAGMYWGMAVSVCSRGDCM